MVDAATVAEPAIKATTFQKVADDLRELVAKGEVSRGEIETRLPAPDLAWLDASHAPTAWIPIGTYERAVELLAQLVAPDRRDAYLIERGAQAAERLSALGIYAQLESTTEQMGSRIGTIIVSVARMIFNFGEWRFVSIRDLGFEIHVEQATAMPEVARLAVQGFVQYVASRATGTAMRVTSQRPRPDLVVIRGTRPS
jgi:hypothetical protein